MNKFKNKVTILVETIVSKIKKENPSPDLKLGWKVTTELINIHKAFKQEVNFNKQNKKLAIYLVLGGTITFLVRSLRSIELGYSEEFAPLQRLISDSMDLTMFFCELPENSRQLTAWFNGKIIERKPGNQGNLSTKERSKSFKIEQKAIKNMDDTVKTATKVLSTYVHPTYDMATITFDKPNNSFKYFSKRGEILPTSRIKSLVRLSAYPAITAFGLSLGTVFLLDNHKKLIKNTKYLKTLTSFTKKIYPECFV